MSVCTMVSAEERHLVGKAHFGVHKGDIWLEIVRFFD